MTPDKYQNTGKLERILDGIQRKIGETKDIVKGMYDKVTELATTTDAIYDTVNYHHDSPPYSLNHDDFLDEEE